jgi:hypothetical protein
LAIYLDIAEAVLRAARRPMTALAMMDAAHRAGVVPTRLFGKTQHKTLGARLSLDILHNKLESRFYRTDPGRFFLSEFRSDPSIPEEFKDPFHARRRTRDLQKSNALAVDRSFIQSIDGKNIDHRSFFKNADLAGALRHVNAGENDNEIFFVWALSVVRRRDQVLSYRVGQYRDSRDTFTNRRSIGFVEMVGFEDVTLFSNDMGVAECGLRAVLSDLDLTTAAFPEKIIYPVISQAIATNASVLQPAILFIMEWQCPDWFEPTKRRLSLNGVQWINAEHYPNDIESFEPWSAIAFQALIEKDRQRTMNEKNSWGSTCCTSTA